MIEIILQITPVVLSILSIILTIRNQTTQNKKWDHLNEPNIELEQVKMVTFKELNKKQATETNWEYKPTIYSKGESGDLFQIPHYLKLFDNKNQLPIARCNPIFTLSEINQELTRVGYKGEALVLMAFKPKFEFQNTGKTVLNNLSLEISMQFPNGEWQTVFTSNSLADIGAEKTRTVTFEFYIPLNEELPEEIKFKIIANWKNHKMKDCKKTINTKWTSTDNFWTEAN